MRVPERDLRRHSPRYPPRLLIRPFPHLPHHLASVVLLRHEAEAQAIPVGIRAADQRDGQYPQRISLISTLEIASEQLQLLYLSTVSFAVNHLTGLFVLTYGTRIVFA